MLRKFTELLQEAQEKIAEYQESLEQLELELDEDIEKSKLRKAEHKAKAKQLVESNSKPVKPVVQDQVTQIEHGKSIEKGDRAIAVERTYTAYSINPKNMFADEMLPQEGGKFLLVELKVKNIGKEPGNIFFSTFHVTDENEYKFESVDDSGLGKSFSFEMYAQENGFSSKSDTIRPTGSIKILQIFEVNQDSKNLKLHWKGKSINLF